MSSDAARVRVVGLVVWVPGLYRRAAVRLTDLVVVDYERLLALLGPVVAHADGHDDHGEHDPGQQHDEHDENRQVVAAISRRRGHLELRQKTPSVFVSSQDRRTVKQTEQNEGATLTWHV